MTRVVSGVEPPAAHENRPPTGAQRRVTPNSAPDPLGRHSVHFDGSEPISVLASPFERTSVSRLENAGRSRAAFGGRAAALAWRDGPFPGTELPAGRSWSMIFHFDSDAGIHGRQIWSAELATVRDAQIQAVQTLGELLSEDGSQFWVEEEVSMTVSDKDGVVLFRLDLGAIRSAAFPGDGVGPT